MTTVKKLSAQQKLMIKRRQWMELGFTKDEYQKFEQDLFNGYLSRDIVDNLQETKTTLDEIKNIKNEMDKSSKEGRCYFLCTFIIAIVGIVVSLVIGTFY